MVSALADGVGAGKRPEYRQGRLWQRFVDGAGGRCVRCLRNEAAMVKVTVLKSLLYRQVGVLMRVRFHIVHVCLVTRHVGSDV